MTNQEIIDLLRRYQDNECTELEKRLVESWYQNLDVNNSMSTSEYEVAKEQVWKNINPQRKKKNPIYRYAAIFAVLLSIGTLMYLATNKTIDRVDENSVGIRPGKYRATFVSGGNDSLDLNTLETGGSIESNGIRIKKLNDGMITYAVVSNLQASSSINKLIVPRGGQYKIMLADSTVVIVNSESELEFPTQFTGVERRIKMIGEGYFEVVKNKNKPFIVESGTQEVTVLGTKFNIRAYRGDQNIVTTLVEGKVRVKSSTGEVILHPGDQSLFDGNNIRVSAAKLAVNIAWKNDLFVFESEPLGHIMQQVARWYKADVSFENKDLAYLRFTGSISKYQDIQQVLQLLEMTGKVKFVIDNQTIYVKAK